MKRKKHTPEQIIDILSQVEALVAKGCTNIEAAQKVGITENTYYRWKKKYAGMGKAEAKRLRELERENARLKKLVANQALDIDILKEVIEGKY